jgi:Xaa-Pro aminopeptidase
MLTDELLLARLDRLCSVMAEHDVPFLLTADPINICYATGARNMTVYGMMGAVRFLLVSSDGRTVLWEFAGCDHLAAHLPTVHEVRRAPSVTATSGPGYTQAAEIFADELMDECRRHGGDARLGVERMDYQVTDSLRRAGFSLSSATEVFIGARMIKLPSELDLMQTAADRVQTGVASMIEGIEPGRTEIEIWSEFHRHLIANEGEYVVARLVQSGERTFPYFHEAGTRPLAPGDLFSIDTDATGFGGYAVDFSRTFVCGGKQPSPVQRSLHGLALDQLQHNASLLAPGRTFEEFATRAWKVPERHRPFGYYCLAHGLGLSGEHPNVPLADPASAYNFPGQFEPGMVICVESYIGDPEHRQGIKLEDQFVITADGSRRITTFSLELTQ